MTVTQQTLSNISATHWGIVHPVVENGKISEVLPFEHDCRPSPNLKGIAELPYCQSRIRYPMVRESYLKDGIKSRHNRGNDKWVRVTWEEAVELVASELKHVYSNFGPSAVFGNSYGWKSTGNVNAANTLLRRFLNLCGGYVPCVNSYSTAAISTILPYVVGSGDLESTNWEEVLRHSQRVILWGADPLITNDIDWCTTLHNAYPYFEKLKQCGIKTIDINPVRTETGAFLNSEWIAPKPGTDCALMLGLMYELENSGRTDSEFLKRCTFGFEQFKSYLFGKSDGTPKTPEWAAKITGLSTQKIRSLAHELSDNRTMIMMGWGIQRIEFGEQPHWMGITLASMLGQIGLPGGGIGTNYHYSSGGCTPCIGPFVPSIASRVDPVLPIKESPYGYIPVARFADCFLNPGKTIFHNGRQITYPKVRVVLWAGGNPFAHQPQTNRLVEAWKQPETIVVTDYLWTATARQADIVLPSQTVFEHNDISGIGTYTNDGIVANKKVIEPLFESKSDYEIFSLLAEKMGCLNEFTCGLDEFGWIKQIYNSCADRGAQMGMRFPSFDEFWQKGYLLYPKDESLKSYVSFKEFRENPEAFPLKTESGKIQLFSPKIASYGYKDCLGHAAYFEPTESLNRINNYPLALMTTKSPMRLHSQLDGTIADISKKIQGREPVWIHPENAKSRRIKNGDVVLVKNDRGSLLAGAVVSDKIRKDVVLIRHGAWFDPVVQADGSVLDVHGNSNTLTQDIPTSNLACGNVASSALVEVQKFEGRLPEIQINQKLI